VGGGGVQKEMGKWPEEKFRKKIGENWGGGSEPFEGKSKLDLRVTEKERE